ncbi:major facilitator superfamily protein [Sarocladium implicatum]|nr:major facilitator superfamily protein [Sarocladium implicatum]
MSLVQHVTQAEGFDYDGRPADSTVTSPAQPDEPFGQPHLIDPTELEDKNPEWRRLSYAPIDLMQGETPLPNSRAYTTSNAVRLAQVATAVLACWLSSGIVFGFAALKPVLIAEGVYGDLCETTVAGELPEGPDVPCAKQDLRLNLFFISASITANVSSLCAGAALDKYGRRACWVAGSIILALGSALMVSSFRIPSFDGYIAANVFLAFGGTMIFVPSFQMANAFPKHSGLIVALVTGAFDASAAVFLFYRIAYEASGGLFTPDKFFLAYLLVPSLLITTEFLLMPRHAYHTVPQLEEKIEEAQDVARDVHESDDDISDAGTLTRVRSARADKRQAKLDQLEGVLGDAEERDERVKLKEERQETSSVWGVLHGVPAHRQMLTPWFILILVLTIIQMQRMNYFIATIRAQYRYMLGSDDLAERINETFDVALPVGGLAATPFIGLLLNNLGIPTVFGLMTILIVFNGVLNCLSYMWAGYATVIAFVVFRPMYYSTISDYATKVFGFATFGRIYGTLTCLSGLLNFFQSSLDALTHGPLKGNPFWVNVGLGALGSLFGIVLTIFTAVKGKEFTQERTESKAGQESRRLLSSDQDLRSS